MSIRRKAAAELLGTFWLVFGGVGSAVLAGERIGNAGIALAFGLTVLTMAYAIGHISGAHLNPAVTVGLAMAGRIPAKDVLPYVVAQRIGAFVAAWVVLLVAQAGPYGYSPSIDGLGANGYGVRSPDGYSAPGAFLMEAVTSFVFLNAFAILGLRSLYVVLSQGVAELEHLHTTASPRSLRSRPSSSSPPSGSTSRRSCPWPSSPRCWAPRSRRASASGESGASGPIKIGSARRPPLPRSRGVRHTDPSRFRGQSPHAHSSSPAARARTARQAQSRAGTAPISLRTPSAPPTASMTHIM
jgi:glycerol uptake facilitator-like aquaporin